MSEDQLWRLLLHTPESYAKLIFIDAVHSLLLCSVCRVQSNRATRPSSFPVKQGRPGNTALMFAQPAQPGLRLQECIVTEKQHQPNLPHTSTQLRSHTELHQRASRQCCEGRTRLQASLQKIPGDVTVGTDRQTGVVLWVSVSFNVKALPHSYRLIS